MVRMIVYFLIDHAMGVKFIQPGRCNVERFLFGITFVIESMSLKLNVQE